MILCWPFFVLLFYGRGFAALVRKFETQAITLDNHAFIITRAEDTIPSPTPRIPTVPETDARRVEELESLFMADPALIVKRIAWLEYLTSVYIDADDYDRANRLLDHLWWWVPHVHCLVDINVRMIWLINRLFYNLSY